ncbi:MAG: PilZ domain-containing protein [Candidatus Eremiobacteraeota bacterium]|nr:PilZ domain-containing protein [Candidatus Eremiobacteraeota bacterium]
MFWRIVDFVKGRQEKQEKQKSQELFSLEFCKISAIVPPDIEALVQHITRTDIIFKTRAEFKEGEVTPLRIIYHPIEAKGGEEVFATPVKISKKGQLAAQRFLYQASYEGTENAGLKKFFKYLKSIESAQISTLVDYHDRRRHYRLNRVLPVVSKHLKGFKALTRDISSTGLRIACDSGTSVKKGDIISIRLELDDYGTEPLQLNAEICWVADSDPDRMQLGLRFINLTEDEMGVLSCYLEAIRKSSR